MELPKEVTNIIFEGAKKHGAKTYGSFRIEKLKGGFLYKYYYEMDSPNYSPKLEDNPSYIKLVFPDKKEFLITPLTELQNAFKKSNAVSMARFEFELKVKNSNLNYLYIATIGDYHFDLPEGMAKEILSKLDIKLNIYP